MEQVSWRRQGLPQSSSSSPFWPLKAFRCGGHKHEPCGSPRVRLRDAVQVEEATFPCFLHGQKWMCRFPAKVWEKHRWETCSCVPGCVCACIHVAVLSGFPSRPAAGGAYCLSTEQCRYLMAEWLCTGFGCGVTSGIWKKLCPPGS